MFRQIEISQYDEQEGLGFDLQRARTEGLFEEIAIFSIGTPMGDEMNVEVVEVPLSVRAMEEFNDIFTDLGANMGPGEVGELKLVVRFRYGYGPELRG